MEYSDRAVAAMTKAGAAVMLPGEGTIVIPRQTIVVPECHVTRGAVRLVAEYPGGDAAWAAFAGSLGGRRDALVARIETAIWEAASSPPDPDMLAAVKAAKARLHSRVRVPRLAPIQITIG